MPSNTNYANQLSRDFINQGFTPFSPNAYHLLLSNPETVITPSVFDFSTESINSVHKKMICTRLMNSIKYAYVISRANKDWQTGTVYTPYSSSSTPVINQNSLVLVDDALVFVCLDNNNGAASTVKPTLKSSRFFVTNDGYAWKFLYEISESQRIFVDSSYIPVYDFQTSTIYDHSPESVDYYNAFVGSKKSNTLEYIRWVNKSLSQNAYYEKAVVTDQLFGDLDGLPANQIRLNATASGVNDYYTGMTVYVVSGTGEQQARKILSYNGTTKICVVQTDFVIYPSTDSYYHILPSINIVGDSYGAVALSILNGSKYFTGINILEPGEEYHDMTVTIDAPTSGTTPTFAAILSPSRGLTNNLLSLFDVRKVKLVFAVGDNYETKVPNDVKFSTYGILNNPLKYDSEVIAGQENIKVSDVLIDYSGNVVIDAQTSLALSNYHVVGQTTGGFGKIIKTEIDTRNKRVRYLLLKDRQMVNYDLPIYSETYIMKLGQAKYLSVYLLDSASSSTRSFTVGNTVQLLDNTGTVLNQGTVHSWSPAPNGFPGSLLILKDFNDISNYTAFESLPNYRLKRTSGSDTYSWKIAYIENEVKRAIVRFLPTSGVTLVEGMTVVYSIGDRKKILTAINAGNLSTLNEGNKESLVEALEKDSSLKPAERTAFILAVNTSNDINTSLVGTYPNYKTLMRNSVNKYLILASAKIQSIQVNGSVTVAQYADYDGPDILPVGVKYKWSDASEASISELSMDYFKVLEKSSFVVGGSGKNQDTENDPTIRDINRFIIMNWNPVKGGQPGSTLLVRSVWGEPFELSQYSVIVDGFYKNPYNLEAFKVGLEKPGEGVYLLDQNMRGAGSITPFGTVLSEKTYSWSSIPNDYNNRSISDLTRNAAQNTRYQDNSYAAYYTIEVEKDTGFFSSTTFTIGEKVRFKNSLTEGTVVGWEYDFSESSNPFRTGKVKITDISTNNIELGEDIQKDNLNNTYTDKGLRVSRINTPDLLPYSGNIIFAKNIASVQRDIEQTETFQFVLEF